MILNCSGTMENMEKIVFSKTLVGTEWKNSRVVNALNKQEILGIKERSQKDIIVFGSPGLAGQLIELNLVDDYYFLVQPFISGAGPRLFNREKLTDNRKLHLKDVQTFPSGTVILGYHFA